MSSEFEQIRRKRRYRQNRVKEIERAKKWKESQACQHYESGKCHKWKIMCPYKANLRVCKRVINMSKDKFWVI